MTSWLDDIRKRLEAATPGRWSIAGSPYVRSVNGERDTIFGPTDGGYGGPSEGDAALIASAPTDLARLLRVAEAAQRLYMHSEAVGGGVYVRVYDEDLRALRAALADEPGGGR